MLKCCYCYPQNVFKNGLELKGFEMVKLHLGFEGSTYQLRTREQMEGNLPKICLKIMRKKARKGNLGYQNRFLNRVCDIMKKLFQKDEFGNLKCVEGRDFQLKRKSHGLLQKFQGQVGVTRTTSNVNGQKDKYEVHNNLKEQG